MDLEAAENAWRDPRDQISYKKTTWFCPCNGCKKAEKRERERIASLIQEQHLLSSKESNSNIIFPINQNYKFLFNKSTYQLKII